MKTYIYPQNLKARSRLWLWSIRDFLIVCLLIVIAAVLFVQTRSLMPFAAPALFAFLSIRAEDNAIIDYILCAFRYFVSAQQIYFRE